MKAKDHIAQVQAALLIPESVRAPRIGPLTRAAFDRLASLPPDAEFDEATVHEVIVSGTTRDIGLRGIQLVKHFESLFLEAYKDPVGIWTIGWGHTGLQHNDGTVRKGRVITEAKAEELLRYDMNQFEARVCALVKTPLTQDQFDALVSFDFNTGGLTLDDGKPSTITRKLNARDYEGAANEFLRWDKAGGQVLKGLTRRRMSERNLFRGLTPFIVTRL